uniref:Major facilitator superfamily (MFS) profile domain-containing protein n=1 Tax=Romanomermis culicivorax TaxID=13658 RepID=A0A915K287_ROMCU
IDKEATDSFAPWAIAAFGFGQTVGCPLFGWVSNKLKNNKSPMIIGMIFMIIGNTGYCMVELFPYGRRWLIFTFRVITGFGGGIAGVIRAYCATAAKSEEYTKAVTGATATLALAIMAGPGAQAMFTPIGFPGFTVASLPIHMFNAPGWISIVAALICVYLLHKLLIEEYPGIQTHHDFSIMPKYDSLAAWTLIFCWFAIYLTLTSFVMIGKSYTMVMFHWSFDEAVVDNGIIMGVFALVSLSVFVIYAFYGKRLDERFLIFSGTTMMISFWLITFPWPALPELLDEADASMY